jgi:hypothetical protein
MAGENPVLSSNPRQAFANELRQRSSQQAEGPDPSPVGQLAFCERVS